MNFWEKILLAILAQVATELPVLIHSKHGAAVFNASDAMLSEAPNVLHKPEKAPAPPA